MSRSKKIQIVAAAMCVIGSFFLWHVYKKTQEEKSSQITNSESMLPDSELMNPDSQGKFFGGMPSVPVYKNIPGVTDVVLRESSKIELPDDAKVLMVSQNGNVRAYLPEGMSNTDTHIVHDTLGQQPITVAYCDVTDHGRAFYRQDIKPEDFRMGGWSGKEMSMLIKGKQYNLSNPSVPLLECPLESMNFSEFKKKYPDAKIYLGDYEENDEP